MEFEFDIDDLEDEIREAFQPKLNTVVAAMGAELANEGREIASQRLDSGLKHWDKGFQISQVEDGHFIISVTGKLAEMMEDGIEVGEISDMIMAGNRAKANDSGYVDVPIGRDVDSIGNIKKTNLSVSAFKDADSLMKNVTFSDYKKGGVRQEKRVIQRVKDIIKSTTPETGAVGYLSIRRVTEDSVWPSSPYSGAKVLEELERNIEATFDRLAASIF